MTHLRARIWSLIDWCISSLPIDKVGVGSVGGFPSQDHWIFGDHLQSSQAIYRIIWPADLTKTKQGVEMIDNFSWWDHLCIHSRESSVRTGQTYIWTVSSLRSVFPFVFMYSVSGCQTALLFPAFYDYRAKLSSPGSPQRRVKIAILPTGPVKHRNKLISPLEIISIW